MLNFIESLVLTITTQALLRFSNIQTPPQVMAPITNGRVLFNAIPEGKSLSISLAI